MKHSIYLDYKYIRLRPLNINDLEYLRKWRNDGTLNKFLRPIGEISYDMQKNWYDKECKDNTSITFAIEETRSLHRIVGSVAVYDINGDNAEVGKIVIGDPAARGKKIGYYALLMAMYMGFERFGINRYTLEVHEDNMPAKINYLKSGFVEIGNHPFISGGKELDMSLTREMFYEKHAFVKEIKMYEK